MKKEIFISWSGPRSKFVAEALYNWIPLVIQSVNPWMSSEDIHAGDQWFNEISKKLENTQFGIICVTPENLTSPWLLFEAGALAKTITDEKSVCPYLINLNPTDFQSPLNHFQSVKANEDDTLRLVKSINNSLDEDALNEGQLKNTFDRFWPDLQAKLKDLPTSEVEEEPKRDSSDILSEVLEVVRALARSEAKKDKLFQIGGTPYVVSGSDSSIISRHFPKNVVFDENISKDYDKEELIVSGKKEGDLKKFFKRL